MSFLDLYSVFGLLKRAKIKDLFSKKEKKNHSVATWKRRQRESTCQLHVLLIRLVGACRRVTDSLPAGPALTGPADPAVFELQRAALKVL